MVRRLIFIIHQRDAFQSQGSCGKDLRVGVMADGEIKLSFACPPSKGPGSVDKIAGFGGNRAASMNSNYFNRKLGGICERNGFGKVTSRDLDFVTFGVESVN
jgi:hypothetical protein